LGFETEVSNLADLDPEDTLTEEVGYIMMVVNTHRSTNKHFNYTPLIPTSCPKLNWRGLGVKSSRLCQNFARILNL